MEGAVVGSKSVKGSVSMVYGKDGKSAYEVAKANGFEGTEQEWLESLRGEQGEKGDKGDTYEITERDKADIAGMVTENHVISQGEKDGWRYRLWTNGMAECWTTIDDIDRMSGWGMPVPFPIKRPTAIANIVEKSTGYSSYFVHNKLLPVPVQFWWVHDLVPGVDTADQYVSQYGYQARCIDLDDLSLASFPETAAMVVNITGEWKDLCNVDGEFPIWEGGLY